MDKIIEILKPLNYTPSGENWYTLGQLFGYDDEQLGLFKQQNPHNPIKSLITHCSHEQMNMLDKNLRLIEADNLAKELNDLHIFRSTNATRVRRPPVVLPQSPDVCVICMDNPQDTVTIPCGHMFACNTCTQSLLSCPICRRNDVQFIKVFKA